jgi:hypothetical protein
MRYIIERSKLCLDHSTTLYGLYAILCLLEGGPKVILNPTVIMLLIGSSIVATQIGRFSCQQVELLPIPLGATITASAPIPMARLRACLPMITGTIARIMSLVSHKSGSSPDATSLIPLQMNPPSTPTKSNFQTNLLRG